MSKTELEGRLQGLCLPSVPLSRHVVCSLFIVLHQAYFSLGLCNYARHETVDVLIPDTPVDSFRHVCMACTESTFRELDNVNLISEHS